MMRGRSDEQAYVRESRRASRAHARRRTRLRALRRGRGQFCARRAGALSAGGPARRGRGGSPGGTRGPLPRAGAPLGGDDAPGREGTGGMLVAVRGGAVAGGEPFRSRPNVALRRRPRRRKARRLAPRHGRLRFPTLTAATSHQAAVTGRRPWPWATAPASGGCRGRARL